VFRSDTHHKNHKSVNNKRKLRKSQSPGYVVLCFVYILTRLFIQIIEFILTGLIVAKSSITSPIQEALINALKITENHNHNGRARAAMHQLFTSTQKKTAFQAVDKTYLFHKSSAYIDF